MDVRLAWGPRLGPDCGVCYRPNSAWDRVQRQQEAGFGYKESGGAARVWEQLQ